MRAVFLYSGREDTGKESVSASCQLLFLYELGTGIRIVAAHEYNSYLPGCSWYGEERGERNYVL